MRKRFSFIRTVYMDTSQQFLQSTKGQEQQTLYSCSTRSNSAVIVLQQKKQTLYSCSNRSNPPGATGVLMLQQEQQKLFSCSNRNKRSCVLCSKRSFSRNKGEDPLLRNSALHHYRSVPPKVGKVNNYLRSAAISLLLHPSCFNQCCQVTTS